MWAEKEVKGAPGQSRTGDLSLRRRLLYPLSYWGRCAILPGPRSGCVPVVLVSRDTGFGLLRPCGAQWRFNQSGYWLPAG